MGRFATIKESLRHSFLEPPTDYRAEVGAFWGNILNDREDCHYLRPKLLQFLDKGLSTKKPLIDAWNKLIFASPRQRFVVKYFRDSSGIPDKPNATAIEELWKKIGLKDDSYLETLRKEHSKTKLIST